ncbi:hypothetical protein V1506DRAFT_568881 [Lipomyces tetrasporus]
MVAQFINKVCFFVNRSCLRRLAAAKTLLELGAKVALCDINAVNLEQVIGGLDSEQKNRTLAQWTKSHFGKLDGKPQGASVVHIGSMFSIQGFKYGAIYDASKHAALGMVRSAAKETGDRVRVNCILPLLLMHRANLARVKGFTPTPTTPAWSVDGGAEA